jgi:hypothetical protein
MYGHTALGQRRGERSAARGRSITVRRCGSRRSDCSRRDAAIRARQGRQGRIAPLRGHLLPALPTRRPPPAERRHRDEPHRLPVRVAGRRCRSAAYVMISVPLHGKPEVEHLAFDRPPGGLLTELRMGSPRIAEGQTAQGPSGVDELPKKLPPERIRGAAGWGVEDSNLWPLACRPAPPGPAPSTTVHGTGPDQGRCSTDVQHRPSRSGRVGCQTGCRERLGPDSRKAVARSQVGPERQASYVKTT